MNLIKYIFHIFVIVIIFPTPATACFPCWMDYVPIAEADIVVSGEVIKVVDNGTDFDQATILVHEVYKGKVTTKQINCLFAGRIVLGKPSTFIEGSDGLWLLTKYKDTYLSARYFSHLRTLRSTTRHGLKTKKSRNEKIWQIWLRRLKARHQKSPKALSKLARDKDALVKIILIKNPNIPKGLEINITDQDNLTQASWLHVMSYDNTKLDYSIVGQQIIYTVSVYCTWIPTHNIKLQYTIDDKLKFIAAEGPTAYTYKHPHIYFAPYPLLQPDHSGDRDKLTYKIYCDAIDKGVAINTLRTTCFNIKNAVIKCQDYVTICDQIQKLKAPTHLTIHLTVPAVNQNTLKKL